MEEEKAPTTLTRQEYPTLGDYICLKTLGDGYNSK